MKVNVTPVAKSVIDNFRGNEKKEIKDSIYKITQNPNLANLIREGHVKAIEGKKGLYTYNINENLRVLMLNNDDKDELAIVDVVNLSKVTDVKKAVVIIPENKAMSKSTRHGLFSGRRNASRSGVRGLKK